MTTTRITEGGTTRLLESALATERLTEALPPDSVTLYRPFRFGVGPASGSAPVIELADFDAITLKGNKATGWTAEWSMSGTALAAASMIELETDLFVYLNQRGFQRFRLSRAAEGWDANGAHQLDCAAIDYRAILARRWTQTDLTYTGIGQGTIAWNLIAHTQALPGGDLDITAGTLDGTTTRDRTYPAGTNIGTALQQLSEVIDGPWYALGFDRIFHAYAASTKPVQTMPLQLGTTARTLNRASGADRFANAAQGMGDSSATTRVFVDAAGIATDPRGRWETAVAWSSVIDQATLIEHTEAEVEAAQSPLTTWSATIEVRRWLTDFPIRPGDQVSLVKPLSILAAPGDSTTAVDVEVAEMSVVVSASGDVSAVSATFVELP